MAQYKAPNNPEPHEKTASVQQLLLDNGQPSAMPQENSSTSNQQAKWGIHWKSPALMVLLMAAGFAFALGHHEFYNHLKNRRVSSIRQQQWNIRIGTGFAFLTKTSLEAAVGLVFTQHLWVTIKKKIFTLEGLDAAFSLTSDPLSLLKLEVLGRAKVLFLLALVTWFMPLIATITPATLSVETRTAKNFSMIEVPTTNFSSSDQTTENLWSDYMGVGIIANPTPLVTRLLTTTSSSMAIVFVDAPYPNSSYSTTFYGPSMRCDNLSIAAQASNPFTETGDYANLTDAWTSVINDSTWYYNAAAPLDVNDYIFLQVGGSLNCEKSSANACLAKNLSCQQWNTSYTVLWNFDQGIPSAYITDLDYIAPTNSSIDSQIISEMASGVRGYQSMFLALSRLLSGQIGEHREASSSGMFDANLPVAGTGIFACSDIMDAYLDFHKSDPEETFSTPPLNKMTAPWMCRNGSVAGFIEDLSHNFTLSLLSASFNLSGSTMANVSMSFSENYYVYKTWELCYTYLIAIGVTLFCVLLGLWAFHANGYSANRTFSTIMFTTRNADLDHLATGQCLGKSPLPKSVGKTKLQYGITQSGGFDHATFGLSGTVQKLKKGQTCC